MGYYLSASQKVAQPTVIAVQQVDYVWWTWFYNDFLETIIIWQ
jgi:hypothetical protein